MSINILKGFEFKKKDTFIHSLDPRTKLLIAIVYSILALIFSKIIPLLILLLSLIPLIVSGKVFKKWLTSLKGLVFIITFIMILNTWLNSLNFAISMSLRIILLLSAFSLFFMTVHPDDLSSSLLAMKIPFYFTFTLSLANRFIPTLAIEAQNIIDAQRSRGLELEKGNIIKRVKNMVPIIIPLIINSIKRALSVAEALESKAFGAKKERTNYFDVKLKNKDYIIMVATLTFMICILLIYFSGIFNPIFNYQIPL
ncbi:MAG: energy-coupling factor transporter transmembrane component T family protein [Promethearchaeota archaeon]